MVLFAIAASGQTAPPRLRTPVVIWNIPDVDMLPDNEEGRLARYGRSLLTATYAHIGPNVSDPAARYAGNNLACANCHLDGGLKKFGLPLVGAYADYPAYSWRSGEIATIEDRINNCMMRSMNGRALPKDSRQLAALSTFLKVLSTGINKDADVIGQGAGSMALLTRAAGGGTFMYGTAQSATASAGRGSVRAVPPMHSVTLCRRCGDPTVSTTVPA